MSSSAASPPCFLLTIPLGDDLDDVLVGVLVDVFVDVLEIPRGPCGTDGDDGGNDDEGDTPGGGDLRALLLRGDDRPLFAPPMPPMPPMRVVAAAALGGVDGW
jgi:hypothetical protein